MAGLYRLDRVGWIVWIVLARLYRLDRISIGLGFASRNWIYSLAGFLLAGLLLAGWDGWTVWDVSGTEVR